MSYCGDPDLPAGVSQDALDRAINGDPERAEVYPPMTLLDIKYEIQVNLRLAMDAPPEEQYTHLACTAYWAKMARDTALETLGRADGEECKF